MRIIENSRTKIEQGSVRAYLSARGFVPAEGAKRSMAGVEPKWTHPQGHVAQVGYGLVGKTGQSAGCAGWAHTVTIA